MSCTVNSSAIKISQCPKNRICRRMPGASTACGEGGLNASFLMACIQPCCCKVGCPLGCLWDTELTRSQAAGCVSRVAWKCMACLFTENVEERGGKQKKTTDRSRSKKKVGYHIDIVTPHTHVWLSTSYKESQQHSGLVWPRDLQRGFRVCFLSSSAFFLQLFPFNAGLTKP